MRSSYDVRSKQKRGRERERETTIVVLAKVRRDPRSEYANANVNLMTFVDETERRGETQTMANHRNHRAL